jgi:uncharacterized membrane protein YfcA
LEFPGTDANWNRQLTIEPILCLTLIICCLVASVLSAITGFGGAAILLPVLVAAFGMRDAVPILTVMQLIGNASRVWFNRRDIQLPVVKWFALGSVPAGLLGGYLFATSPLAFLHRLLGVFLLLAVAYRRLRAGRTGRMRLEWFAPLGGASSLISALVGSVGPMMAPFFLAFGLTRGAYIGTEALATVVMHVTKLVAYGGASLLTLQTFGTGIAFGLVLILGSYLGKRIVDLVSDRIFVVLIEITLIVAGIYFLVAA